MWHDPKCALKKWQTPLFRESFRLKSEILPQTNIMAIYAELKPKMFLQNLCIKVNVYDNSFSVVALQENVKTCSYENEARNVERSLGSSLCQKNHF